VVNKLLSIQKKKMTIVITIILDSSCPTNQCSTNKQCSTRLNGNFNCDCLPGYFIEDVDCTPCPENFYLFNDTTCLSCPENSTSSSASTSIIDCKCISFNHYPDNQTLTCLPCDYGFLLDSDLNTCQGNFSFFFLRQGF